jgi:hypothetical protein
MASATTLRTSTNPSAPALTGGTSAPAEPVAALVAMMGTTTTSRKTAAYRPEHVQPGRRETDDARRAERQTDQTGRARKTYFRPEYCFLRYFSVCFWYVS